MGKRVEIRALIAAVSLMLAGCVSAPAPASAPLAPPQTLYLAEPQVELFRMDLAGGVAFREDWSEAARTVLASALSDELASRGISALPAGPAPSATLAVLPSAYRHAPGGAEPLPSATSLSDWRVPVRADLEAPILLVAIRSDLTSVANQAAQVGLGLALLSPSAPTGGRRQAWAALAAPEDGRLLAIAHVAGGDVRDEREAREIARRLADQLLERAQP